MLGEQGQPARILRQAWNMVWLNELHALVLEGIVVAENFRRQGWCRAFIKGMRDAVENKRYDLAIVEGVQNQILADALTRWSWQCDPQIMDFYWHKKEN